MNKIILFLIAISIGLSVKADYAAPIVEYPVVSPSAQQYNVQAYYQNPYQVQQQKQYINPYQYGVPYYAGTSVLPYPITGTGTGGASQIIKNIGQSVIYSMLRGY